MALLWLATYLLASSVVLLVGRDFQLVAIHVTAIVIALWVMRPGSRFETAVGDLLPLVTALLLYAELPRLIAALHGGVVVYHDMAIQRWEFALFGGQPARSFARNVASTLLSELLHAGYLLYYAAIFVPPLILFARGERRGLGQTVVVITITATVCWTIFAFIPVEGPRYAWGVSSDVPDGLLRRFALSVLAAGSSRGTAFPSSHVAISVAQTVVAFRWQPRLARLLAVVTALIGVGAVYGGFHYAIDTIAGALLGGSISFIVLAVSLPRTPNSTDLRANEA